MEYPSLKQEGLRSMSSYFRFLKSVGTDVLSPAVQDFFRSAPDALFIGSGILALVTQNYPLGIFMLTMIELTLVSFVLGKFIGSFESNTTSPLSDICIPGIPSPYQISVIGKVLTQMAFPSGPVFFLTGSVLYTVLSVLNFKTELTELGQKDQEWKTRIPLSITFSMLFIIAFCSFRMYSGCDSIFAILGSVVLGGVVGGLLYLLHVYLFGRDAINFLGLPLLGDKTADGRPLYVCAPQAP
jgi:hypothetical protein